MSTETDPGVADKCLLSSAADGSCLSSLSLGLDGANTCGLEVVNGIIATRSPRSSGSRGTTERHWWYTAVNDDGPHSSQLGIACSMRNSPIDEQPSPQVDYSGKCLCHKPHSLFLHEVSVTRHNVLRGIDWPGWAHSSLAGAEAILAHHDCPCS